jgi:nitrogen regulatory protein P-II 1
MKEENQMYLLVSIVEEWEKLIDIMEGFAKAGIQGSTVLDSIGMGRVLMKARATLPVMEQINKVITDLQSSNKTIITVIRNKDMLEHAIGIVKSFCGDLCQPGKGILFALPLEIVEGLPESNSSAHT